MKVADNGRTFKHQIMSLYVSKWGWPEEKVKELDQIHSWPFSKHVMLSKRIHKFLIQCYRRMSKNFKDLEHTVNQQDMTVLGRRLESFYAKKPNKIDILRSGFGEELYCPVATIRAKRQKDGSRQWTLYSGDFLTTSDKDAMPYKVHTESSTTHLVMWCIVNHIIDQNTQLLLDYDSDPVTEVDLQNLASYASKLFKPLKVNSLAREQLLASSEITACLVVLNMESSRLKAHVDNITLIYSTSWGERYIENGKDAFIRVSKRIKKQKSLPQRYMVSPDYSHKQRLEQNFQRISSVVFNNFIY